MKKELELITVYGFTVAVDNELQSKFCLTDEKCIVSYTDKTEYFDSRKHLQKIIAHNGQPSLVDNGLPLLPPVEQDVEQLKKQGMSDAYKHTRDNDPSWLYDKMQDSWVRGYKAAQPKQFTLEQALKIWEAGVRVQQLAMENKSYPTFMETIQSLQPVPKFFEAEMESHTERDKRLSKLGTAPTDAECQRRVKTTTIDGKTYLVGRYVW